MEDIAALENSPKEISMDDVYENEALTRALALQQFLNKRTKNFAESLSKQELTAVRNDFKNLDHSQLINKYGLDDEVADTTVEEPADRNAGVASTDDAGGSMPSTEVLQLQNDLKNDLESAYDALDDMAEGDPERADSYFPLLDQLRLESSSNNPDLLARVKAELGALLAQMAPKQTTETPNAATEAAELAAGVNAVDQQMSEQASADSGAATPEEADSVATDPAEEANAGAGGAQPKSHTERIRKRMREMIRELNTARAQLAAETARADAAQQQANNQMPPPPDPDPADPDPEPESPKSRRASLMGALTPGWMPSVSPYIKAGYNKIKPAAGGGMRRLYDVGTGTLAVDAVVSPLSYGFGQGGFPITQALGRGLFAAFNGMGGEEDLGEEIDPALFGPPTPVVPQQPMTGASLQPMPQYQQPALLPPPAPATPIMDVLNEFNKQRKLRTSTLPPSTNDRNYLR